MATLDYNSQIWITLLSEVQWFQMQILQNVRIYLYS